MNEARWLLLLCVSRMGFALINVCYSALIPSLRPDWRMSASEAGLVQSAWHAGYIVSLVAASIASGRYGAKRTFIAMAYAACASAFAFAFFATGFRSAFLLYGFAGICAGGSYVPGLTLIAERFVPSSRGRAMGYYIAAASLGYALSLIGTSALAVLSGPAAGFLLAACGTLLGMVLAAYTLRATPNIVPAAASASSLASMRWLWNNKPARYVILAYALHAWELLGMWAWLPSFLGMAMAAQGGTSPALVTGATLAALTHLISMAGSMGGGILSDRWGRTRAILLMAVTSAVCSLLFGWLAALPMWLLMVVAVLFNLSAIGDSAIYSAALTEVVPEQHLATAYSIRSVLGFGMGALSPWLFGLVLDLSATSAGPVAAHGWGLAWAALGAVALIGPCFTYRLQLLQAMQREEYACCSRERRDAEQIGMDQQQNTVRKQAGHNDGQVVR